MDNVEIMTYFCSHLAKGTIGYGNSKDAVREACSGLYGDARACAECLLSNVDSYLIKEQEYIRATCSRGVKEQHRLINYMAVLETRIFDIAVELESLLMEHIK
jgi:hypothetical protein